jgi:hypothetical protein
VTEARDDGVGNLLAARAARCVQRTLDPLDSVHQWLVVADESECAEAKRFVDAERERLDGDQATLSASAPIVVLTRDQAFQLFSVLQKNAGAGNRSSKR